MTNTMDDCIIATDCVLCKYYQPDTGCCLDEEDRVYADDVYEGPDD